MLSIVNDFGPFQWICISSFCVMILPVSYQVLIMYFLALQPQWRCARNSSTCTLNGTFDNSNKFRCSIPREDWEFTEAKHFSIVTQFDIYCETEWLLDLTTGIFFVGACLGGLILGRLADNIGRKHVLFISLACIILNGLVLAFMPNIYFFIALRFLSGVFYAGTKGQMVVMAAELVGAHRRPFAGNIVWLFYSLASCILALKAYFIHDWKVILISCTAPYLFVLLFYKQVPESVRWLAVKEKTDQVNDIWKQIAKRNKRSLAGVSMKCIPDRDGPSSGFFNLFQPLSFAVKTFIQAYIWLTTSMVYYGLSLAADELGGNLYRNFALVSMMECPGHISCAFLSNKYGRKKTAMIPIFIAGLTCIAIPFIPSTGGVILGMLGKFFITTCYSCIYLWSAEIFPTSNRSKGIGLMQVFEMIGGACAPFIVMNMLSINKIAPFLLLGFCAIIASGLMMFLPETKSRDLK